LKENFVMSIRLPLLTLLLLTTSTVWAVDPQPEAPAEQPEAVATVSQAELFKRFEQTMSGAKLTGKFTVVGKSDKGLKEETYEIKSVQKLEQGDYWLFKARIKYGEHDVVVPMPLEVKWAGDTPLITLTDTTIPGLGTFSARVVIHNDWYAGTWVHGKVGGHLFGTISRGGEE
jgi:hypothetical protein